MKKQSNSRPIPQGLTIEESLKLPPVPCEPYTSSPWELDRKAYSLECYEQLPDGGKRHVHSVPLDECMSHKGKWEWINYLHSTGASDHVIASLVRDLRLFLGDREGGYCDVRAIVQKHLPRAIGLRGKRPRRRITRDN